MVPCGEVRVMEREPRFPACMEMVAIAWTCSREVTEHVAGTVMVAVSGSLVLEILKKRYGGSITLTIDKLHTPLHYM